MRVQEWEQINQNSLESVVASGDRVELVYRHNRTDVDELARLVAAENGCCGAAGVEFAMRSEEGRVCVSIDMIKEGLPARTVMSAFSEMIPPAE